jgi:hypothetical protein
VIAVTVKAYWVAIARKHKRRKQTQTES